MMLKTFALSAAALLTVSAQAAQPAATPASHPAAPYSEIIAVGDTYYVSGHIGVDSATGKAAADAEMEARLALDSVKHTLESKGLSMDDLVAVTVYCTDLELYEKFNSVYRGYFHGRFPTRAFIGINKLVLGAHFEVSGVAAREKTAR